MLPWVLQHVVSCWSGSCSPFNCTLSTLCTGNSCSKGELGLQFATHLAETNCSMLCFVFLTPKPSWSGCRSETAQEATAEKSRCLPAPAAGLQFTPPCFDLSNLSVYSWQQQQQPITACYVSPYCLFRLLLLSDLTLTAQATAVWRLVPPPDCRSAVQRPPQPITACFVQSPG